MLKLFARAFTTLLKWCLSLRYTVRYKNVGAIKKLKNSKRGCLILPNHPAEIDPIIAGAHMWRFFQPRPLVVEKFFYYPGAKAFMKASGAIPIPDFEQSVNDWKVKKGEEAYQKILETLKGGDNLLVYPSGFLKRTPDEKIGGSSLINRLLSEYRDFDIVLMRIDGLWGSMFSRALTGSIPGFWGLIIKGVKIIFKNLIFFTPRRKVTLDFAVNPPDFPYNADKLELNQYLEGFYNQYEDEKGRIVKEEPVRLVSHRFYKTKVPSVEFDPNKQSLFSTDIEATQDVKDKINAYLAEVAQKEASTIESKMQLSFDLGLDSLDIANIYAFMNKEFDLHVKIEPGELKIVNDLYALATKVQEKEENLFKIAEEKVSNWPKESPRPEPAILDERNIPIAFLKTCDRMGEYVACADASSGVMTFARLKLAVLIFAKKIAKMKGEYVGIMLPASVGVYIAILGTMMAKKKPVMLNWTAGKRSLEHAMDLLHIESVISSRRFLDKLDHIELGKVEEHLHLMEDIKGNISLSEKIAGALNAKKSARTLISKMGLEEIKSDDTGVVLFTSGTEAYPKAVPLTHKNILSNQSASLLSVPMKADDIMYGVLPPFHSFGFNVVGLMPLLAGMRVYYSPDPTDAHQMGRDADDFEVTVFACAPSFYKNLLRIVKPGQLRSVRLFVSGAEKAPDELGNQLLKHGRPNADFTIGYGITECSPVVSLQRLGTNAAGVGQPIPGISIRVIHPETEKVLDGKKPGEVCIRGPSVFNGYLGQGKDKVFIEIEGERYYRSADIGYIDDMGCLILSGRLKRFVKIGGEMISLASVEHELVCRSLERHMQLDPNEACFVLSAVEKEGLKPKLGLLTTCKVDRELVNELLRDSGFGRIVKVAKVDVVDKIPMTGTGKIDYRSINARFQHELV